MTERLQAISPLLYRWLRDGKPYPPAAKPVLRYYAWQRLFFGLNLGLQSRALPSRGLRQPYPFFVLGLWRSGTTFLHELLASVPGLTAPRTWQCMAPSTFVTAGRPAGTASAKRPMDEFTIDAFTPQEDEFAALALGMPSVYRALLDPRRLGELKRWLLADSWATPQPHEDDWVRFLELVAQVEGGGRLLLKSPGHSFRWRLIQRLFPSSPCVWVVRDPSSAWASNVKMWEAMADVYGLAPLSPCVLDDFLEAAFSEAAGALARACAECTRSRLVVVDFDLLVRSPVSTAEEVVKRLLPDTAVDHRELAAAALRREKIGGPAYAVPVPSAARADILRQLSRVHQDALVSHGL